MFVKKYTSKIIVFLIDVNDMIVIGDDEAVEKMNKKIATKFILKILES